jgi:hypothetical protein
MLFRPANNLYSEELYLFDVTPCSPLKLNLRFGRTFYFFGTYDGSHMFLLNVGRLSMDYMTLYPRRQNCSLSTL